MCLYGERHLAKRSTIYNGYKEDNRGEVSPKVRVVHAVINTKLLNFRAKLSNECSQLLSCLHCFRVHWKV